MTSQPYQNTGVVRTGVANAEYVRTVSVSKTRPDDTTAYDAEDVISEDDTNDAGTPWVFDGALPGSGEGGYITLARLQTNKAGMTAQLTLFLFDALPTSELDDNAANTTPDYADVDNYLGRIDFPALSDLGGDSSWTQATPSTTGGLPLAVRLASGNQIFGVLVTRAAFTPDAEQEFTIALELDTREG